VTGFDPWRVLMAMDAARALLFAGLYALSVLGVLSVLAVPYDPRSVGRVMLVVSPSPH